MNLPVFFNAKESLNLYGLTNEFFFLKNLYINKKLPSVLMMSGKKGIGKFTLINHLMFYIFDRNNYNDKNCELNMNSVFHKQFINNIFSNIIILSGANFKNSKVEDIRKLKTRIFQSSILDKPRFIIFDDVELFNNNSLNALLKIIEEPTAKNFFILINNKSKPLADTIKSRCLEIKIILNEKQRQEIINSLIKKFDIDVIINEKNSQLTPGQFVKFNYIFDINSISTEGDFLENLANLLNLYKKNKDIIFIDMVLFLTNNYFNNFNNKNLIKNEKMVEYKRFVFENINKFFLYNINQNALLSSISNKINNE